jgi:hypothetical protein
MRCISACRRLLGLADCDALPKQVGYNQSSSSPSNMWRTACDSSEAHRASIAVDYIFSCAASEDIYFSMSLSRALLEV